MAGIVGVRAPDGRGRREPRRFDAAGRLLWWARSHV